MVTVSFGLLSSSKQPPWPESVSSWSKSSGGRNGPRRNDSLTFPRFPNADLFQGSFASRPADSTVDFFRRSPPRVIASDRSIMRWNKISLIGVGLMGGSLALALKKAQFAGKVHAFVRREASV